MHRYVQKMNTTALPIVKIYRQLISMSTYAIQCDGETNGSNYDNIVICAERQFLYFPSEQPQNDGNASDSDGEANSDRGQI